MSVPTLTPEQRANALAKASEARKVRSDWKKKIHSREITAVEALEQGLEDEILSGARVSVFLQALPTFGKAKALETQKELGIVLTRKIRGLGARQLTALRQTCADLDRKLQYI